MNEDINTSTTTLEDINEKIEKLISRIEECELQISYLDLYKISTYYKVTDSSSIETAFASTNLYSSFIVSTKEKSLKWRNHTVENDDIILKLTGNQEYIVKPSKSSGQWEPSINEDGNIITWTWKTSMPEVTTKELNLVDSTLLPGITLIYDLDNLKWKPISTLTGSNFRLSNRNSLVYTQSSFPPYSLNFFTENYGERVFYNYSWVKNNSQWECSLPNEEIIKIIEVF